MTPSGSAEELLSRLSHFAPPSVDEELLCLSKRERKLRKNEPLGFYLVRRVKPGFLSVMYSEGLVPLNKGTHQSHECFSSQHAIFILDLLHHFYNKCHNVL